jgi:protein TonB
VEPEEDQRPRAKPEVALEQRAGPDPESRTAAEPARRPRREPKPEATGGRATPPASDPDGGRGPVPRAAKSAAKQGAAAARPSPASRGRKQEAAGAPGERSTSGGGRGDGSPTGKKAAERRYLDELQRAIARHRYYPPKARKRDIEGSVTLYFVIHADGRIGDIRVARSSGSRLLDDAGLRTLERLGRFKPIPNSIGRSRWPLRVPISFALK